MSDSLGLYSNNLSPCTIHPFAKEILFENRRAVAKVFRDVIGLCELDHVSIAIINNKKEIIFLSSTPSLEYNLIESGLWAYDGSFHPDFYKSNDCMQWENLYLQARFLELKLQKQIKPGFKTGISLAKSMDNNYLVYSFATKSRNLEIHQNLLNQSDRLLQIGQYCLQKITEVVPFNDLKQKCIPHPYLKLVKKEQTL